MQLVFSSPKGWTPFLGPSRISIHTSYSSNDKTRHGGTQLLRHHLMLRQEDCCDFQAIPSYIGRCSLHINDDSNATFRLPSRRPAEVAALSWNSYTWEPQGVAPDILLFSLLPFPSCLSFISQLHQRFESRSDQGTILAERTKFSQKSLFPVKSLMLGQVPLESCRQRKRPQVNLAEGSRDKCWRGHQNT